MKSSVLVFIDGTICDDRKRLYLYGTAEFNSAGNIMDDIAVAGSVECLKELHENYDIIYIGARSEDLKEITSEWLKKAGFPDGRVFLAECQEKRLEIVKALSGKYDIAAGIGDRWDDNELHLEIGCKSIILEEYKGNWDTVRKHLLKR